MRKEPVCHDGVLLRDETPARWCTSLFLKASLCSSIVVHAPLSPPPPFLLLLNLHVSFPRFPFLFVFLFLGASVPPLLPFLSTVKAKGGLDTSGWQACGRPGAGDLSMSGRQTAAGVWGRVEADEALLKDSVGLEKKEGTEERAGAVVGRGVRVGWSKAVSQADGQCWRAQEETLNVWWFW